MKKQKNIFNAGNIISSVFMMLTLSWFTVSAPFVFSTCQEQIQMAEDLADETAEDINPFSNSTEEKTESGSISFSEYLPHGLEVEHPFAPIAKSYKCHPSELYFDFHPQLISPPPDIYLVHLS